MVPIPREHGAYGQLIVPIATALAVAGPSAAAALVVIAVTGAFLAHEPLLLLAGQRGMHVRREHRWSAAVWLCLFGASAAAAAAAAFVRLPGGARWTLVAPAVPALAVAVAIGAGREKSVTAEVCVSLALSASAVPVAVAAGAPMPVALAIASAFALQFVLATLAVRLVIACARGGGNAATARSARRSLWIGAVAGPTVLAGAGAARLLPWTATAAVVPAVAVAVGLAISPPPATRLRALGWSLVVVSVVTAAVLIVGLTREI